MRDLNCQSGLKLWDRVLHNRGIRFQQNSGRTATSTFPLFPLSFLRPVRSYSAIALGPLDLCTLGTFTLKPIRKGHRRANVDSSALFKTAPNPIYLKMVGQKSLIPELYH